MVRKQFIKNAIHEVIFPTVETMTVAKIRIQQTYKHQNGNFMMQHKTKGKDFQIQTFTA